MSGPSTKEHLETYLLCVQLAPRRGSTDVDDAPAPESKI